MPVKKTIDQYALEIKELYNQIQEYPDSETIYKKLRNRINSFVNLIDITIFVASNEQHPWTLEDIGYNIRPMLLKGKETAQQVGDYQAYYQMPGRAGWVGILVERKGGKKGCEDLYSTLINAENCARFYREIGRFNEDKRFSQMSVIAECSFEQYLLYQPPFVGKTRNTQHIGASVEARRGKIASLYARGVPVIFAGTRKNAIEVYKALIRQWLIKNYVSILGLDSVPYNDATYLSEKLSRLEAEMLATKAALGVEI